MNILEALVKLRDDIKIWVTNNLNALNAKIDEKTIPIDSELSLTSTNPVQNKAIKKAIDNIPTFSGDYNDLINAPDISEDDSGNMIIADEFSNIIFKADADGIHTTAVSLNGETAASEKYVDEAIANIDIPEVDFTGYATEDFVTGAVDSAKEELSESIVTESDEWKVVDESGNIIFSVDADGAHTTSLSLNGESVEDIIDARIPAWAKEANKPTYTASGLAAHAEGSGTIASGENAHAEGAGTVAEGYAAHTEGYGTFAYGNYSHAEGGKATSLTINISGSANDTTYTCNRMPSEFNPSLNGLAFIQYKNIVAKILNIDFAYGKVTLDKTLSETELSNIDVNVISSAFAMGDYSHSEGQDTFSYGIGSHAEGNLTKAMGNYSHAEGYLAYTDGEYAHAEGYNTYASGPCSHAQGYNTQAFSSNEFACGKYNLSASTDQYAITVGNGSDSNRSNAYTLDWQGNSYQSGSVSSTGADYAEYFEWLDGNFNEEDRVGLLVTLDGDKIKLANGEDEILGIVSGTAAVLGDNYECAWQGKYLTDDFGRVLYEEVEEFIDVPHVEIDEEGNTIETIEKKSLGFFKHPILNPEYDPEQEYINRANRPEWDTVGMFGKLYVRDDGTAIVNGYIKADENGIATYSSEKTNMRVLSRVNENIIRVLLK